MHFIGSQHAETEVRSAGMVSVDYILQHLPYVVLPYVHMLQKLLFKYAVYPFGNSVVTWVVPFRHADSGVASTKHFHVGFGTILKSLVRVVYGMLTSPALPESHLQCRHGVLMPHVIGNLPSHYFSFE